MPYKSEKIKLPPEFDRRRKLSEDQKEEIRHKYKTGSYSMANLAREYGVSKKTVLLIVNPESKRKNDQHIKDHWKNYAPTKEERNASVRNLRSYKNQLYKEGKISEEDK